MGFGESEGDGGVGAFGGEKVGFGNAHSVGHGSGDGVTLEQISMIIAKNGRFRSRSYTSLPS